MPDDRPSFSAALETEATKAGGSENPTPEAPASSSVAAPSSATPGTTTPPPGSGTTPAAAPGSQTSTVTTGQPGQPPAEKWEEILGNARSKAAADALTTFRREHGLPEDATPDQIRYIAGMAQRYREGGPIGFLTSYVAELQQNPELAAELRSHAGRILASRKAAEDPEPQPDWDLGEGVKIFSPAQQAKREQWLARNIVRTVSEGIREELAPVISEVEGIKNLREAFEANAQNEATAKTAISKMEKLPYFKEHKEAINKVFYDLTGGDRPTAEQGTAEFLREALWDAYTQVLHGIVIPGLPAKQQAAVLADLQTRAHGSTSKPGGPAADAPPQVRRPSAEAFSAALKQQRAS